MAEKYLKINASGLLEEVEGITSSAGAGDSGKVIALDGTGKLDNSFMPTGIGADTATIEASENLSAGDLVNIYDSSGAKCRKADASDPAKMAHGFVLAGVTSGSNATVYFEGDNSQVSGLTPGEYFLSGSTPGGVVNTPPTTSGYISQRVGIATAATNLNVELDTPVKRA